MDELPTCSRVAARPWRGLLIDLCVALTGGLETDLRAIQKSTISMFSVDWVRRTKTLVVFSDARETGFDRLHVSTFGGLPHGCVLVAASEVLVRRVNDLAREQHSIRRARTTSGTNGQCEANIACVASTNNERECHHVELSAGGQHRFFADGNGGAGSAVSHSRPRSLIGVFRKIETMLSQIVDRAKEVLSETAAFVNKGDEEAETHAGWYGMHGFPSLKPN
jgi:hypothetical protein